MSSGTSQYKYALMGLFYDASVWVDISWYRCNLYQKVEVGRYQGNKTLPAFTNIKIRNQSRFYNWTTKSYHDLVFRGRGHAAVVEVIPLLLHFILSIRCVCGHRWVQTVRGEWIQLWQIKKKHEECTERRPGIKKGLTVTSSHPSIVVGHSNEVVNVGPSFGVANKLGHVQVSEGRWENTKKKFEFVTPESSLTVAGRRARAKFKPFRLQAERFLFYARRVTAKRKCGGASQQARHWAPISSLCSNSTF